MDDILKRVEEIELRWVINCNLSECTVCDNFGWLCKTVRDLLKEQGQLRVERENLFEERGEWAGRLANAIDDNRHLRRKLGG